MIYTISIMTSVVGAFLSFAAALAATAGLDTGCSGWKPQV